MTESTVSCDRCLTRIDAGRTLLLVECGPLRSRLERVDLCSDCGQQLAGFLESGRPTSAPENH